MSAKKLNEMTEEELMEAQRQIDEKARRVAEELSRIKEEFSRIKIDLEELSTGKRSPEGKGGTMNPKEAAELANKARKAGEKAEKRGLAFMLEDVSKLDAAGKMNYFRKAVTPGIREAFERGDKKYTGARHFATESHLKRTAEEDIRHVECCHISVRLREAEDLASTGNLEEALKKIESAVGYLVILHMRVNRKLLIPTGDK